ncbi:TPA: Rib/alpha-like domain-containing protein, partial [Streptococcus suis]
TSVAVPDGATVAIDPLTNKPVVPVTVTYPDGTTDTINVPVKQADAATHTPSLKTPDAGQPAEALISVPATADTPITSQEDKDAITAKVDTSNLPEGTTVTVPDDAKVTIVDGKPVVPVTVTYPDGSTDTINVPVKQADTATHTPSLKTPDAGQPAEALISVPATADTPITSQDDKDAITAKVDTSNLPDGTTVTVPDGAKVTIVDGKPVVPVTVTYLDGTTDTINVPVKQADAATHTPSLKTPDAGQPAEALISVPATSDTPITSQEDKDAITAKVDTSNLPDGTTVTVPDGAKVTI